MTYCDLYLDDLRRVSECMPGVDKLRGATILITGATGMIGSAVADLLLLLNSERGYDMNLYLAGRSEKRMRERFYACGSDEYTFVRYDATEPQALAGHYNYIIHAASNADPKSISEQPLETMMSNIVGTIHLLTHLKEQGDGRMVFVSSSEVYGTKDGDEPYGEEDYGRVDILNPRAAYPTAKRAAETLCVSAIVEHAVDAVIVRPGHVYGPTMTATDSRASSQFTRDVLAGESVTMTSEGLQLRSYCYCLDCATAILTVMLHGTKGSAYNISNPNSVVTIRQMAEALARAGCSHVTFRQPTAKERGSYNLMTNSSLRAERLMTLGWRPLFDMDEGARHTIAILSATTSNN